MNLVPARSFGKCKERSCLSKRRYWSHVDALVMATRRQVPSLGAYACANCGGWHLTRHDAKQLRL